MPVERIIEVPVERIVERIVEKVPVEKIVYVDRIVEPEKIVLEVPTLPHEVNHETTANVNVG